MPKTCYHSTMKLAASLVTSAVILLNTSLGLRGLWQQDKDFGTMHPFSDPVVECKVHAFEQRGENRYDLPLPISLYRNILSAHFTSRLYLEQLPYFERGFTGTLRRTHPNAQVHIDCNPLYGLLPS